MPPGWDEGPWTEERAKLDGTITGWCPQCEAGAGHDGHRYRVYPVHACGARHHPDATCPYAPVGLDGRR